MRINSIPPKDLINSSMRVRERLIVDKPATLAERAELTSEAKTFTAALRAAKEAIEMEPVKNQNRVEEITKKIADGTYRVSGEDVARKMLGR
ncbi:MAG: flagellar biosynthesis anti-sigma factor FlgM [Christensenellales bacterium]|jgi:flagellar biosynthesis anti-sigma factor FlgM